MSIAATVANNHALNTIMRKAIPVAYASLCRHLLSNPGYGSRSISNICQPRLMPNQSPSTFKHPYYSPISPSSSSASCNVSRHFSTDRHLDPYERFTRRTAFNWGIKVVPQQEAFVVERFGKFYKVLEAGLHVLIPFVDSISYVHSLKEQSIEIPEQPAVTADSVSIRVNGALFVKIIDAETASYCNDNVMYAVSQLAQTVMRRAIGKMPLNKISMEIDTLNANIVEAINVVVSQWGLICVRYMIRNIIPPPGISMVAEAERRRHFSTDPDLVPSYVTGRVETHLKRMKAMEDEHQARMDETDKIIAAIDAKTEAIKAAAAKEAKARKASLPYHLKLAKETDEDRVFEEAQMDRKFLRNQRYARKHNKTEESSASCRVRDDSLT